MCNVAVGLLWLTLIRIELVFGVRTKGYYIGPLLCYLPIDSTYHGTDYKFSSGLSVRLSVCALTVAFS